MSTEVLKVLLPYLSKEVLTAVNENGSPPLHWAIMNNHVAIVQLLIEVPEEKGGGVPLLKVRSYHILGSEEQFTDNVAKESIRERCIFRSTICRRRKRGSCRMDRRIPV